MPALTIGRATHMVVAGRSIVSVDVHNLGNVRLKPLVDVTLLDAAGSVVSHANGQMDTFYAHTDTFVEVRLDARLQPGSYTVVVRAEDVANDVQADEGALALLVEAPPVPATGTDTGTGLTDVIQSIGEGLISLAGWGVILVAVVLVGVVALDV